MDRQYNDNKEKDKRTNNNLQNTTQKGVSETVNLRRTDNTMTIRKRTRGQIIIYKTYTERCIRNCQTKKDRQHNDNKEKDKRTNNNLQNTTQKGVSETVKLRRTENTMTIRKRTRGQTIIYKTLHRKVYQKPSIQEGQKTQ